MAVRIRGDSGKFEMKGYEPRRNRVLTLTDTAWERLKAVASARGMSRSDLIETAMFDQPTGDDAVAVRNDLQGHLDALEADLLEDEGITRKGKDRGVVKRVFAAIRSRL